MTTARAQTQPFVPPTLGTKVFYSSGGSFEADSLDGTTVRVVNTRLAQVNLLAACHGATRQEKYDPNALDKLWPLKPGKTVTTEVAIGDRRWSLLIRAVGQQKVRTQAGTFHTWLITIDDTAVTHAFRAIYQCWYAPDIGLPVKRHEEIKTGNGTPFDEEAVRVEKQDRSKVAQFHPPRPGTVFYTTAGSWQIDGTVGTSLAREFEDPDKDHYWLGSFFDYALPRHFVESMQSDVDQLWPLEVGKSISFQHDLPATT